MMVSHGHDYVGGTMLEVPDITVFYGQTGYTNSTLKISVK